MATRVRIYTEGDPPLRPYPWPLRGMLDGGVWSMVRGVLAILTVSAAATAWLWRFGAGAAAAGGAAAALFTWVLLYGHGGFDTLRMGATTQLRREVWFTDRGIWMIGQGGGRRAAWDDIRFVEMDHAWILWIGRERMGTIPESEVPRVRHAIARHAPVHPVVEDGVGRRVPLGMPR